MRLYEIEEESKWHIQLKEIENAEDAGDEFFTEDELKETLGVSYISTYSATIKSNAIIEVLQSLKAEMKQKVKKSIIIEDDEFVDFLQDRGIAVSDYVKGLRRVGNRLSLHEKTERKVAKKSDAQSLISLGFAALNKGVKYNIDVKYAYEDYASVIRILQKLVTWEQMVEHANGVSYEYEGWRNALDFMKQVWDEPDMFQKD